MTRPNFAEWLGDTDGPKVIFRDTGELVEWVGQGLVGDDLGALQTAVENSAAYLQTEKNTTELWIVCRVGRENDWLNRKTLPWQLTSVMSTAMAGHGTIAILFAPVVKDGLDRQ
jgi:hypothetical protein